jgi:hypothetical protein
MIVLSCPRSVDSADLQGPEEAKNPAGMNVLRLIRIRFAKYSFKKSRPPVKLENGANGITDIDVTPPQLRKIEVKAQ